MCQLTDLCILSPCQGDRAQVHLLHFINVQVAESDTWPFKKNSDSIKRWLQLIFFTAWTTKTRLWCTFSISLNKIWTFLKYFLFGENSLNFCMFEFFLAKSRKQVWVWYFGGLLLSKLPKFSHQFLLIKSLLFKKEIFFKGIFKGKCTNWQKRD